jgi:hypothetical protein
MGTVEVFWNLGAQSDRQLLEGLRARVGNGRQLMAEVLAHLGEVEERRLHLLAGYGSMFAYCVSRLGMSEDEACRRIDVARLARRYPTMYPRLASGQLSLSVVALLKPHLSTERGSDERRSNESAASDLDGLVAAVSGKTVQQAREALAARFPRPDVESSIRKLPGRNHAAGSSPATLESVANPRAAVSRALAPQPGTLDIARGDAGSSPAAHAWMASAEDVPRSVENGAPAAIALQLDGMSASAPSVAILDSPSIDRAAAPVRPSSSFMPHLTTTRPDGTSIAPPAQPFVLEPPRAERLDPLSPGRYRVQFTADVALKEKLELARDLMRHTLPAGDLATIVARSLDLLIEQLMKRRFGASARGQNQAHKTRRPTRPPTKAEQTPTQQPPTQQPPTQQTKAEQTKAEQTKAEQTKAEQTKAEQTPTQQPPNAERSTPQSQSEPTPRRERPSTSNAPPAAPPREPFRCAAAVKSPNSPPSEPSASSIDRATRRAVLERDGLQCAWRSEDGVRCEARGWLEHDHVRPRARGGSSSVNNGRILCRAHNRLAAEQEFGRQHVEEAIAARRAKRRLRQGSP